MISSPIANIRPQQHLLNILLDTKNHHPNFTLLLGAGASITSGVKTAKQMIDDWRTKYCEMHCDDVNRIAFLKQQAWYNSPSEYSLLFEKLYDQPSQRREYIESCLEKASPSWGYIYLINLIRNNTFNTIFTTNFDDLINEACYLFSSDVRPIVSAHDSSIRYLRITSKRPKIIKLHGDFLFDNIKNTVRELESLEDNIREKFRQYAAEFGLIVVGYSGHDRTVMDTLDTLLRSEANFPHGIYWCVKKDTEISPGVHNLARFSKFSFIEISGFDEFFAELNEKLQYKLQPEMSDPYTVLTKRLNALLSTLKYPEEREKNKVIEKDIRKLATKIEKSSRYISSTIRRPSNHDRIAHQEPSISLTVPFQLLAEVALGAGDTEKALSFIVRTIETEPTIEAYDTAFKILKSDWNEEYGRRIFESLKENQPLFDRSSGDALNIAVNLMDVGQFDYADQVLDMAMNRISFQQSAGDSSKDYFTINKAQIKKHQGKELTDEEVYALEQISSQSSDIPGRIGALIVLGRFNEIENLVKKTLSERPASSFQIRQFLDWPIFRLLSTDDQIKFKELMEE